MKTPPTHDANPSIGGASAAHPMAGPSGTPPTHDANPPIGETGGRHKADGPVSRRAVALRWGLGGLIAAPFAILPHELGHYVVLLVLGVPDLALHYVAVTWDLQEFWAAIQRADFEGAAAIAPIPAVALADAMGPLVTYAVVAGCCYGCARWRPHPALIAVAFLSQFRIRVGARHVVRDAFGVGGPANFDELRVAILTGIPVEALVGFALLTLLASGIWLARFFPRGRRVVAVASMTAGMAVSLYLYAGVFGPWLLP